MDSLNHFVFIIPFRNVENYINQCANSLINQTYQNWTAIFCNDASTDNTLVNIPKDDRFIIRTSSERLGSLANKAYALLEEKFNDEDIICLLDGDDYLLNSDSLENLNKLYNDSSTLLTYGQYITKYGIGHCREMNKYEIESIRISEWLASHLKTFKFKLYSEFLKQDPNLSSYKDDNGYFYSMTCDLAMMFPLIEIAGYDYIKFCKEPIYFYRLYENNDHIINVELQRNIEQQIRNKTIFKTILN